MKVTADPLVQELPWPGPPPARVVIGGGGQAGARAALAIRDAARKAAIALLGDEHHPPYERSELSKSLLLDAAAPVPWVVDTKVLRERRINLRTGCAVEAINRAARTLTWPTAAGTPMTGWCWPRAAASALCRWTAARRNDRVG